MYLRSLFELAVWFLRVSLNSRQADVGYIVNLHQSEYSKLTPVWATNTDGHPGYRSHGEKILLYLQLGTHYWIVTAKDASAGTWHVPIHPRVSVKLATTSWHVSVT